MTPPEFRILITDTLHPSFKDLFGGLSASIDYKPQITQENLWELLPDYHGIILRSRFLFDKKLIERGSRLQFLARAGAGMDAVDEVAAKARGIKLINAPEGNQVSLAEHCVGMILSLLHKLNKGDKEVRKFVWDREGNRGRELNSLHVGILGFGHMGSSVASRLKGFGCSILAYDIKPNLLVSSGVSLVSMVEFFKKTDILTIHIPLDGNNRNLINEEFIQSFSKNIYVINTARGGVLDLEGLIAGLASGKVLGAALDVLPNEKLDDLNKGEMALYKALFVKENVIFSPHVGGWSEESHARINEVLFDKIKKHLLQNG